VIFPLTWSLMGIMMRAGHLVLICGAIFWFEVELQAQVSVLTWHNDNSRTGQNLQESLLTPQNVNVSQFGKLFVASVDGGVDAQPLYVPAITIPGRGVHNVLVVVTENDTAYAFDADAGKLLWSVSVLGVNETPSDDRGCSQVSPEIGITATPAIDLAAGAHGTIYAVAMSKDTAGAYHHRLHALDLTTGAEEFGGPMEVQATYHWTGTGGASGTVTFDPKRYKERPGLLILNGVVYTSWSSHCDAPPYTGWVMGYNETTLAQVSVIDLTPNLGSANGGFGAIWMAGAGPAADADGNIYLLMANGVFDTTLVSGFPENNDYGNALVKISTSGGTLGVADYFTMSNTTPESDTDTDLGSGGLMLLPPLAGTSGSVSLVVGAGKDGNVYVLKQSNLGKFSPSADNIYQQMSGATPGGVWSSPAWFNGRLYYGDVGNTLKAFTFANGQFGTVASSQSPGSFGYPGTTPSISANGTSNGIAWAAENTSPAVLHAFDANNLGTELYNSNQAANSRDQFGSGNKFIVPTIANGKVYVGTADGVGVFGLLPAVSMTPTSGSIASQTFVLEYVDTTGAANLQTAWVYFNPTLTNPASNACLVYYSVAANQISLAQDSGTAWMAAAPGADTTLQNSQCSLNVAGTSVELNGNTLTLNLPMTFNPAFAGAKNIYMYAGDVSGANSGWQQRGTWTVPMAPGIPAIVSVTPSSESAATETFTLQYSDTAGAASLQTVWVYFNSTLVSPASNACLLYYNVAGNQISLAQDSGTTWMAAAPGAATTLQNSQCSLNVAGTSVALNGNTLTLNLAITFRHAFAGAKNIYMYAADVSGSNSGWLQRGTWTVPGMPATVSVTPNSGQIANQTFALQYSDTAGAANLQTVWVYFNATLTNPASNSCLLYYNVAANLISLAQDSGTAWTTATPGAATTLQNSQCSLNAAGTSVSLNGNTLTLNLAMTFQLSFAGAKNVYMYSADVSGSNSGWLQRGAWTVPGSGIAATVSTMPNSGSTASQIFALRYSDTAGAARLQTVWIYFNSALVNPASSACLLYYNVAANKISLAEDSGTAWTAAAPGAATTLQNSQCSLDLADTSVALNGTTLTLNMAMAFDSAFAGMINIYMYAADVSGSNSGWLQQGTWTVP
jgi:hypothetical protein